jgi:hypothetical protein
MAERKPPSGDSFDRLRAVVDDWERRVDLIAGEMTGTDTFGRVVAPDSRFRVPATSSCDTARATRRVLK